MAERRALSFADLDDAIADVDRLLAGHVTVGRWSLGQICNHLATGFRLLRVGGLEPVTSRTVPEAVRIRFFRNGRFPDGVVAPHPALFPGPGLDDRDEADALRKAVAHFTTSPGPFPPHPFLGPLSKEDWNRFHCMHAAHHLGFAVPGPPGDAPDLNSK